MELGPMYKPIWASLVAQMVKNLPIMWKTHFQSLGWEDPLEEGMATPPVFLPGQSPWIQLNVNFSLKLQNDFRKLLIQRKFKCVKKLDLSTNRIV